MYRLPRRTTLLAALFTPLLGGLLAAPPALAQTAAPAANPLAPLAHWVGADWVGSLEIGSGRKMTLIRRYEWSFDRRLLIGRSFGEVDGQRRQSRETVFFWNADTKRIEFTDFIDQGGFGNGWLEVRDGQIFMDVKVVGGKHPSWRAWIKESGDEQVIRVEAEREGRFVDFGTYPYQRRP